MATSSDRRRSLPTLIVVAFVQTIGASVVGATAVGGGRAVIFGVVFGVVLGALVLGFALFLGWYTHRH